MYLYTWVQYRGQKRVAGLLELKLQVVMSCWMWCYKLNLGLVQEWYLTLTMSHLFSPTFQIIAVSNLNEWCHSCFRRLGILLNYIAKNVTGKSWGFTFSPSTKYCLIAFKNGLYELLSNSLICLFVFWNFGGRFLWVTLTVLGMLLC